jgi:hypothetical protein
LTTAISERPEAAEVAFQCLLIGVEVLLFHKDMTMVPEGQEEEPKQFSCFIIFLSRLEKAYCGL